MDVDEPDWQRWKYTWYGKEKDVNEFVDELIHELDKRKDKFDEYIKDNDFYSKISWVHIDTYK